MSNLENLLEKKKEDSLKEKLLLFFLIILVILVGVGASVALFKPEWLEWLPLFKSEEISPLVVKEEGGEKRSGYQAVFLTNNQVYFGKLSNLDSQYPILRDVYYLRLRRPLQAQEGEEGKETPQRNLTLIKLGNELHGPVDEIRINRDHILFIEDLKEDSKVVKAIREFKARK